MISNEQLVAQYLDRLRAAAADLPPDEREELVSSISEHISTSLADMDAPSEADIRNLLDRLGDPAAIAADARAQFTSSDTPATPELPAPELPTPGPPAPGPLEWGGVVMLGVGSCLLPVIGTIAGLVMVALSRWWTTRQKVVAVALSLSGLVVLPLIAASILVVGRTDSGPRPVEEHLPVQTSAPQPAPTS